MCVKNVPLTGHSSLSLARRGVAKVGKREEKRWEGTEGLDVDEEQRLQKDKIITHSGKQNAAPVREREREMRAGKYSSQQLNYQNILQGKVSTFKIAFRCAIVTEIWPRKEF